MIKKFEDIITLLGEAIKTGDRAKASSTILDIIHSYQLSSEPIAPVTAEKLLQGLNKNRWFDLACDFGQLPEIRNASRPTRRLSANIL